MKIQFDKDSFLKNSYVISIDDKQLNYFYKVMEHIGFNSSLINKFPGITKFGASRTDLQKNCSYSHLAILEKAKQSNFDYVTIFEDDNFPCKDFNIDEFILYINAYPEDAKALDLSRSRADLQYNANFINFTEVHAHITGSNCYLVFKDGYDILIDRLKNFVPADIALHNDKFYLSIKNWFIQCSYEPGKRIYRYSVNLSSQIGEQQCYQYFDQELYNKIFI